MTELEVGDQTIRWDREATLAAYEGVAQGGTEGCGCAPCRNFAVQRGAIYPASFVALLKRVGIGWFYLVGEMVIAGERNCVDPEADGFEP